MTENPSTDPFAVPQPGATPSFPPALPTPAGYGPPPAGYGPPVDPSAYGEVAGLALASPARRLAGFALTVVLFVVTLFVGYLIWALVLWSQGTTPAKRMLGMKLVSTRTGQTLGWGEMCVRNLVLGGVVLIFANGFTAGLAAVVDGLFLFFGSRQRLIDKIGGYQVVMA